MGKHQNLEEKRDMEKWEIVLYFLEFPRIHHEFTKIRGRCLITKRFLGTIHILRQHNLDFF